MSREAQHPPGRLTLHEGGLVQRVLERPLVTELQHQAHLGSGMGVNGAHASVQRWRSCRARRAQSMTLCSKHWPTS